MGSNLHDRLIPCSGCRLMRVFKFTCNNCGRRISRIYPYAVSDSSVALEHWLQSIERELCGCESQAFQAISKPKPKRKAPLPPLPKKLEREIRRAAKKVLPLPLHNGSDIKDGYLFQPYTEAWQNSYGRELVARVIAHSITPFSEMVFTPTMGANFFEYRTNSRRRTL